MAALAGRLDDDQPVDPLVELERLGRRIAGLPPARRAAYLASLPPHKQRMAEYALGVCNLHWRADPSTFGARLDPRFQRYRYTQLLGAAFRRAADGIEPRQIWQLPARIGKSRLASQVGPAWLFDRDPTSNVILGSYGYDLARENAIGVRDMLINNPSETRVRLRADRRRSDRWVTTGGGGLLATGVGGQATGFGAGGGLIGVGGGIILDDLFKNWAAAHSQAERERVWNWYRSVMRLRLNSEQSFIIHVTTRWHEDDVVGHMLKAETAGDGDSWKVYRLPALAEAPSAKYPEPDLLGREPGEPIEPRRFSKPDVLNRQRALGSYLTAALEQQRPAPEEGGELQRSWWQWGQLDPARKADDAVTSWDMKMKDKKGGDYVVGQAWLRFASTAWCVEQLRGQWNLITTRTAIALMQVRHPKISKHLIENTGNGPEVIEALRKGIERAEIDDATAGELGMTRGEREQCETLLRRGLPGIIPVTPQGDKVARARSQSGPLEAGDVYLLESAANGWGLQLVDEAAAFPNGQHDDQVDAWSQAMKYLLGHTPASFSKPTGSLRRPAASAQLGPRARIR